MNSTLILDQVVVSIPKSSIQIHAHFSVGPHDRLAILAPSGFGKSTLFRAISGFLPIQRGRIDLVSESGSMPKGEDSWGKLPVQKRRIGFLFQDAGLFPNLNVSGNLEYALKLQGVDPLKRPEKIRKALARIRMSHQSNQSVETLSGGEKQRLALARLFMIEPQVILLDEPFAALDHDLQIEMMNWVLEMHQEKPVPLIWVTHQEAGLDRLANQKIRGKTDAASGHRVFALSH